MFVFVCSWYQQDNCLPGILVAVLRTNLEIDLLTLQRVSLLIFLYSFLYCSFICTALFRLSLLAFDLYCSLICTALSSVLPFHLYWPLICTALFLLSLLAFDLYWPLICATLSFVLALDLYWPFFSLDDYSRVKLENSQDESDYINATYIVVSSFIP